MIPRTLSFLAAIALLLIHNPAIAAEPSDGPARAAEQFYAGYLSLVNAEKDTSSFVAKSNLATTHFKKSCAKIISSGSVDVDPVLQAQDTPASPFKAVKTTITGGKATVILAARYSGSTLKLNIRMPRTAGHWQIDSVTTAK